MRSNFKKVLSFVLLLCFSGILSSVHAIKLDSQWTPIINFSFIPEITFETLCSSSVISNFCLSPYRPNRIMLTQKLSYDTEPQGVPARDSSGSLILVPSALDNVTKQPVYMPETAFALQNSLKQKSVDPIFVQKFILETNEGTLTTDKKRFINNLLTLRNYAHRVDLKLGKKINFIFKSKNDTNSLCNSWQLRFFPVEKGFFNELASIPINVQEAMIDLTFGHYETIPKEHYADLISVLSFAHGTVLLTNFIERKVFLTLQTVADSAWNISDLATFKAVVQEYNGLAYYFGYTGYEYGGNKFQQVSMDRIYSSSSVFLDSRNLFEELSFYSGFFRGSLITDDSIDEFDRLEGKSNSSSAIGATATSTKGSRGLI